MNFWMAFHFFISFFMLLVHELQSSEQSMVGLHFLHKVWTTSLTAKSFEYLNYETDSTCLEPAFCTSLFQTVRVEVAHRERLAVGVEERRVEPNSADLLAADHPFRLEAQVYVVH